MEICERHVAALDHSLHDQYLAFDDFPSLSFSIHTFCYVGSYSAAICWEADYTLDRSALCRRANTERQPVQSTYDLESPIKSTPLTACLWPV